MRSAVRGERGRPASADGCGDCLSQFATRLLDRLRNVPGIEAVALASSVPLDIHGLPLRAFTIEGRAQTQEAPDRALSNTVSNDYFKAMGVPIVAGSDFAAMNDTTTGPQVMVNQEFVRRFVTGEVVGRRLEFRNRSFTIAGVVRDSTYEAFGEPPTPAMFFAFRDRPSVLAEIHLRAKPGMGVPAMLMSVAVVACWLPARRATMVDPIAALRSE